MIMYVFDKRWPGEFRPATTHKPGTRVIRFTVDQNWQISQVASEIRALAGGERTIWLLRLCAHGNAGKLYMGEGLDVTTVCFFSPLRGYFTPDGLGIEIHGCGVASDAHLSRDLQVRPLWTGIGVGPILGLGTRIHVQTGIGRVHTPERALAMNSPRPRVTGVIPAVGYTLLRGLANATGARVTASYDGQLPDREFRWEGRGTMSVEPDR